jgi:hypothetical protein
MAQTGASRVPDAGVRLCPRAAHELAAGTRKRPASSLSGHLVRPDRRDEAPRHGSIGWIRQWIESVNDTLKGQLDLQRHGGRTTEGTYTRIAQRLLAMAACIWRNWATGEPVKRSLTAFDN